MVGFEFHYKDVGFEKEEQTIACFLPASSVIFHFVLRFTSVNVGRFHAAEL
jgi:hypothetical protein